MVSFLGAQNGLYFRIMMLLKDFFAHVDWKHIGGFQNDIYL